LTIVAESNHTEITKKEKPPKKKAPVKKAVKKTESRIVENWIFKSLPSGKGVFIIGSQE